MLALLAFITKLDRKAMLTFEGQHNGTSLVCVTTYENIVVDAMRTTLFQDEIQFVLGYLDARDYFSEVGSYTYPVWNTIWKDVHFETSIFFKIRMSHNSHEHGLSED